MSKLRKGYPLPFASGYAQQVTACFRKIAIYYVAVFASKIDIYN